MKELAGMKWGNLAEEMQQELLEGAFCVDAETGKHAIEGECIVDLTDELSVSGRIIDGEIVIDSNAILYNPEQGIILNEVMTVTEAAQNMGIAEGTIRDAIRRNRLVQGIDYRKAGRITLVSRKAIERIWGNIK